MNYALTHSRPFKDKGTSTSINNGPHNHHYNTGFISPRPLPTTLLHPSRPFAASHNQMHLSHLVYKIHCFYLLLLRYLLSFFDVDYENTVRVLEIRIVYHTIHFYLLSLSVIIIYHFIIKVSIIIFIYVT